MFGWGLARDKAVQSGRLGKDGHKHASEYHSHLAKEEIAEIRNWKVREYEVWRLRLWFILFGCWAIKITRASMIAAVWLSCSLVAVAAGLFWLAWLAFALHRPVDALWPPIALVVIVAALNGIALVLAERFSEAFSNEPQRFGRWIRWFFPRKLKMELERLAGPDPESPVLVIRGIYPSYLTGLGPLRWTKLPESVRHDDKDERVPLYLVGGRYDLITSGLMLCADATLLSKFVKNRLLHRDYRFTPSLEKQPWRRSRDLPLWFRQSTPERPLDPPDDDDENDDGMGEEFNACSTVITLACVENTFSDPLCLIRVLDIVRGLGKDTFEALAAKEFITHEGWHPDLTPREGATKKIVDGAWNDKASYRLSFDPGRMNFPAGEAEKEHRKLLSELVHSIEFLRPLEKQVVLRPGDAIVIDNFRAMSRRMEPSPQKFRVSVRSTERWLRLFYGFPMVD